jgi:predicted nuclease with TOPRIM domain
MIACTCLGLSHNSYNIYINPENSSARVGRTFSINISASNVSPPGLWAYEFKLYYNRSLLEAVSAKIPSDHFLKSTLSLNGTFILDPGTINQTEGTVSFVATLIGAEPGKTGNGTLANITFAIIAAGKSDLRIGGYLTSEPKFIDGNGSIIPNTDYSLTDGHAEGLPPSPPTIPSPPSTPGKQTFAFHFTRLYGYLTFPEECHPASTITHELIVAAEPDGIHLNYFKLDISCNTSIGQKTLYNETIENKNLPETWILNETIRLTIPGDGAGRIHCTIAAETYRQFTASDNAVELDTTNMLTMTYEEMQTAYSELLKQHNDTLEQLELWMTEHGRLNSTYQNLLHLHNLTVIELQHWQNEYQTLNDTYYDLLNHHDNALEQLDHWINEYSRLNNTFNQLQTSYVITSSNYTKLQMDYTLLKSLHDSLRADYNSLNSTYNSLEARYNDLLEKNNLLNSTYQELKLNFTVLVISFDELKYNLTILQAKYDNLSKSYNLLNSTYSALLIDLENLRSRNDITVRELWLTRMLWFIFIGIAVAAVVYTIYSFKKEAK